MPDTYYIPQQIDGPENAVWVEYVARATKHADLPEHAIHGSQPKPAFSFETGETQTTEDGHEYPVVQSVPYGVMDDSGVRSPTAEEWAAWEPWQVAQAEAAFAQQVGAFAAEHGANLGKFFAAMAHFPTITLPTTYDEALDAMNAAIEAAAASDDWQTTNRLQNQSRIAQDIYKRILEPNGWTGVKLAQLAQALQGGQ